MKAFEQRGFTWRRFLRSPIATVAVGYVAAIAIVALFAPLIAPYPPDAVDLAARLTAPGDGHPLGTDDVGRDVLSRMIYGARVSLIVGILATLLSLIVDRKSVV